MNRSATAARRGTPAAAPATVLAAIAVLAFLAGCAPAPATDATGPATVTGPLSMTRFTPDAPAVMVPALPAPDGSASGSAAHAVIPDTATTSETAAAPTTIAPTSQVSNPATPRSPHTPTTAAPPPTAGSPAPPKPVAVDLARCAGCTVIAAHSGVAGPLSAALARAPDGALLLAARPDGSLAGVINVPYGVTFPAPVGGVLPCDASGRCFVVARAGDRNAVISAFALAADGTWRDVTAPGGFRSATPVGVAADVTGDGLLDVAVQDTSVGNVRWRVLGWSGDGFTLLGCASATGSALPTAAVLSTAACSR